MPTDAEKEAVRNRARFRCEYCRAPEEVTGYVFHLEHIVPRAKGGPNALRNYALSCVTCNRLKSDHLTGIDPQTGKEERLFDPRKGKWTEHFQIEEKIYIHGTTAIGRATEHRLKLNQKRQLEARKLWCELGIFLA